MVLHGQALFRAQFEQVEDTRMLSIFIYTLALFMCQPEIECDPTMVACAVSASLCALLLCPTLLSTKLQLSRCRC